MKMIDEKGRIFGKVNIIDFIFVVLLLSMIPVFYYGNRLTEVKKPAEKKYEKVIAEIMFLKIMPELASVLKEGDINKGAGGKAAGVLKRIISSENNRFAALGNNDQVVIMEDPTTRDIRASFELNCTNNNGALDFEGYSVRIGSNIVFKTDFYSMQGIVVKIEK
ncbi:MAG: DUF4330 domain-containing protein [Candidatus Omnitrophica bacterium]|nr:DUF4330 domain-containing protein [Candidatus Omnitrophota bacterium]MDD5738101.1 DUF4330 domain-containing protein [Candidatus Omnitrophota bacterium]